MIVRLSSALDATLFEGKAAQLARALCAGLPVPDGYALSDETLRDIIAREPEAVKALGCIVRELNAPVAVRSSVAGEDGGSASFAGVFRTFLHVLNAKATMEAVEAVWDSARGPRAQMYMVEKGMAAHAGPKVGMIVQRMVRADSAGVMFTRNPVTQADERVIEASWGYGEAVVAGLVTPDFYRVGRSGFVLEQKIENKDTRLTGDPAGGTKSVEVEASLIQFPCLTRDQLVDLNQLALRCEACFGADLDMEWAFSDNVIYLLQCRPITTLG